MRQETQIVQAPVGEGYELAVGLDLPRGESNFSRARVVARRRARAHQAREAQCRENAETREATAR